MRRGHIRKTGEKTGSPPGMVDAVAGFFAGVEELPAHLGRNLQDPDRQYERLA
jgi:hypothetical protein